MAAKTANRFVSGVAERGAQLALLACIFLGICSPVPVLAQEATQKPGTIFSDSAGLPEMVVVPPGTLAIGAPTPDEMRWHQPSTPPNPPPHEISFPQPFAIAKYPITLGEWKACVAAGGCNGYVPELPAYPSPRPDTAVTRISYLDALSYVAWLNTVTSKAGKGAPYALPSETQWEYAATANAPWTDPAAYQAWLAKLPAPNPRPQDQDWPFILLSGLTPRAWQDFMAADVGGGIQMPFQDIYYGVQKMYSNSFGVAGMLAPNAEWTADCWTTDFSKPTPSTCQDRVVHGEWAAYGMPAYPTDRTWRLDTLRLSNLGFRVVRTLP